MMRRSINIRRRFWPTLLLALLMAVAPLSSLLVMAAASAATNPSHNAVPMPPCPLHGEARQSTDDAGQQVASDDLYPAATTAAAGASPNCYCSLMCHAMIDLPALFVVVGRSGKPVHSAQRASAAHVFEPAPMPRPPRH